MACCVPLPSASSVASACSMLRCGVMSRYVDGGGGGGMAWPHGCGGGMVWLVCCARSRSVGGGCGVYILALFGGVVIRLLRYWLIVFRGEEMAAPR